MFGWFKEKEPEAPHPRFKVELDHNCGERLYAVYKWDGHFWRFLSFFRTLEKAEAFITESTEFPKVYP